MLLCVALISLSKESVENKENEEFQLEQSMISIIALALTTAMFLSSISLVTKLWHLKYHYDALHLGADSMLLFGITLLPFCIKYHL